MRVKPYRGGPSKQQRREAKRHALRLALRRRLNRRLMVAMTESVNDPFLTMWRVMAAGSESDDSPRWMCQCDGETVFRSDMSVDHDCQIVEQAHD